MMMMMMEDEGHSQMGGVGGSALKVQYLADPDPEDPYVFGPPGSGSVSQMYGSGSFCDEAKIVRKTLSPTVL
jgi:hypothetical protein